MLLLKVFTYKMRMIRPTSLGVGSPEKYISMKCLGLGREKPGENRCYSDGVWRGVAQESPGVAPQLQTNDLVKF